MYSDRRWNGEPLMRWVRTIVLELLIKLKLQVAKLAISRHCIETDDDLTDNRMEAAIGGIFKCSISAPSEKRE